MRRSAAGGSIVAKAVMPSCFRSCRSGDVVSRGYFNGDAVDGGVTLVLVAEESLWLEGSTAATSLELDHREKEWTLGVGGVNIGGSSFNLLLLDTMSSIMDDLCVRRQGRWV